MKRLMILVIAITIGFALVSCSAQKEDKSSEMMIAGAYVPGQTEMAYGYTHGGYVGMAKVTVDDMGELMVSLDEAFLPHTLAMVDIEADEWTESNTIEFDSHGPVYAAKYIEYNGKFYTGVSVGTSVSYVESDDAGMAVGNTDLEKAILRNQGTMAAFYALVPAGQFKIFTDFGAEGMAVTTTSYGGVTKKNSPGYWAFGQTWAGNMSAIEEFIASNGVQFSESDMMRAKEEDANGLKLWSVADAVTGATNSDFKDYFGLAQHAAGKLKTN